MEVRKTNEYRDWIDGFPDRVGRARVLVRIERLILGNPGQHRVLTEGVHELKVDHGPGYRVYYAWRGTRLLLLLAGGSKSSQKRDIARAIQLNREIQD